MGACVGLNIPKINLSEGFGENMNQKKFTLIYWTCNPSNQNVGFLNELAFPPENYGNADPYTQQVLEAFGLTGESPLPNTYDYYISRLENVFNHNSISFTCSFYPLSGQNNFCPVGDFCPSTGNTTEGSSTIFRGPFWYQSNLYIEDTVKEWQAIPFVWINQDPILMYDGSTIAPNTIINLLSWNQLKWFVVSGMFSYFVDNSPLVMFSTDQAPPTWTNNEDNLVQTPCNFVRMSKNFNSIYEGNTIYTEDITLPFSTFCKYNELSNPFFADIEGEGQVITASNWEILPSTNGYPDNPPYGWILQNEIYDYTRWYCFNGLNNQQLKSSWVPIINQKYIVTFNIDWRIFSSSSNVGKVTVYLGDDFQTFYFYTFSNLTNLDNYYRQFVQTEPLQSTYNLNNSLRFIVSAPYSEDEKICISNICVEEYNPECVCKKVKLVSPNWAQASFVRVEWNGCDEITNQAWLTPGHPEINICDNSDSLQLYQTNPNSPSNYTITLLENNCVDNFCETQPCYCYRTKIGYQETLNYIDCSGNTRSLNRVPSSISIPNVQYAYNYFNITSGTSEILYWGPNELPRFCASILLDMTFNTTDGTEFRAPQVDSGPYSQSQQCNPICESPQPLPSPTPTPSITPTNTKTPTVTPTNTPTNTKTPTNTPTKTKTPTVTRTKTPSVTPTKTVTRTQTQTPTKTKTPTPTKTPIICYCYTITNNTGTVQGYGYTNCSTGGGVIGNVQIGATITVCARQNTLTTSLTIATGTTCTTVCPPVTPSPTPTNTVTPSITPTKTKTPTPTATVTPSTSPPAENRCNLLQVWVPYDCSSSSNGVSGATRVFLYNGPSSFTEIDLGLVINWYPSPNYNQRWAADIAHTMNFSNNQGKMWVSVVNIQGNFEIHEWNIQNTLSSGAYTLSATYVRKINLPSGYRLGKGLTAKNNTTLISSTQNSTDPYSTNPSSIIEINISNPLSPLNLNNGDITSVFDLPVAGNTFNTNQGSITIDADSRVDVWGDLVLTEDNKLIIVGKQVVFGSEYAQLNNKVLLQYNYSNFQIEFIKEYNYSTESTGKEMHPSILNGNVVVTVYTQGVCPNPSFCLNTVNQVTGEIGSLYAQAGPILPIIGPFGVSSPKYLGGTNPCINASLTPNIV